MMGKEEFVPTQEILTKVMGNLQRNNMEVHYLPKKEDVLERVCSLLQAGDKIAVGGSQTLEETGVLQLLREGDYQFIDRYEQDIPDEMRDQRLRDAFFADDFLCSANAVTMDGEIYQVDGLSNRIAPLVFGPKQVILVVGINKIVPDLNAAVRRVRELVTPAIVKRMALNAPCAKLGHCISADDDPAHGCPGDARRCCNFLLMGRQRIKNRVKVLLVGESLGL